MSLACLLIGSDLLRLCREDLIQICGTADGIRLFNALQAKYDILSQNVKHTQMRVAWSGLAMSLCAEVHWIQHLRIWTFPLDPDTAWLIAVLSLTVLTRIVYIIVMLMLCILCFLFMQMSMCSNKLLTVGENWLAILCAFSKMDNLCVTALTWTAINKLQTQIENSDPARSGSGLDPPIHWVFRQIQILIQIWCALLCVRSIAWDCTENVDMAVGDQF